MLGEVSSLSCEVLSHHMASLHSKDNPQGSPALLLIQLLFTPPLLENIWQNERFKHSLLLLSKIKYGIVCYELEQREIPSLQILFDS